MSRVRCCADKRGQLWTKDLRTFAPGGRRKYWHSQLAPNLLQHLSGDPLALMSVQGRIQHGSYLVRRDGHGWQRIAGLFLETMRRYMRLCEDMRKTDKIISLFLSRIFDLLAPSDQ